MEPIQILYGAIGGVAVSLTGLFKNKDRKFEFWTMFPTVIVSTIVGGIAGAMNVDYGIVEGSAYAGFIGIAVQNIWKGLVKRFK